MTCVAVVQLQLPFQCCHKGVSDAIADLTGLVDLLKDWMNFHQSLSGLPKPILDRQSVQPVSRTSATPTPAVEHQK